MAEGRLAGKVAIVTGGANGIGRATALRFAREGARVAIADLDQNANDKTLDELRAITDHALAVPCDVGDEDSVRALVEHVEQAWGPINVLFNNAGIEDGDGNTDEMTLEAWERIQRVNTRGVFLVGKYGIKSMLRGNGGAIVTTSSVGAFMGGPGLHSYGTSKAAVISLARSWAVTYAHAGVRSNVICPGLVLTPMVERIGQQFLDMGTAMTPLHRGAQPEEIANVVTFLASDEASFVTASVMLIDGGLTAI